MAGVGMPEMASSLDRAVVVAEVAASVAACNRETAGVETAGVETAGVETAGVETAGVDATRGPAVEGVDRCSEDMMTAAATNTTNRDTSATVVTKARLRRLRRPRVRKAACTGARGSVVSLACSHRASGHDIDSDVRPQFGIGGGRSRSGSGSQTGACGAFAAGPAVEAAAGSDADPRANCSTASTFAVGCGVVADPESDTSEERRDTRQHGARSRSRAPAPSCSCASSAWGRRRSRCSVGWWCQ